MAKSHDPNRHISRLILDVFDRRCEIRCSIGQKPRQAIVGNDNQTCVYPTAIDLVFKMHDIDGKHVAPPGYLNFYADFGTYRAHFLPINRADDGLCPSANRIEALIYFSSKTSGSVGVFALLD